MSIKYLQDQQLNQIQQSPNDSPWAKLVAQSEMLERNKMRQPQGQAPQGTVAGNIQQQLIDAQMKQESEAQNADLYKSQMLAQLIGSGHLPANFAAQGYASGGLTQPTMQPGTGVYRGIMVPSQQPQNPMGMPTSYTPPNSQDPNAQEKKHGMLQSLLDNSIVGMAQGKANIGNAMQDYADLFSGKVFSRGFAEGGDIRGFVEGGSLFGYDPNLNSSGLDPRLLEAQDAENAARLRATEMVRKMHLGDAANKGVLSQLERDTHPLVKRLMEQEAQNANNLKATEMVRKMQLGQAANQGVIPETPVPKTTSSMAETMAEAIRANKEYIPKTPNPTAGMNESMARTSAENAARMEAAKAPADDWLKPKAGEAPYKSAPGMVEKGLGAIKKGLGSLGTHAGELLSEAAVPMDIYGVSKTLVGNTFPLAYQAITGNKTPDTVASGELPDIVSGVNFNAPSEKAFNPNSPISATSANDYESLANLKPNDMQRVTDRLKGLWGGDSNSVQPDAWTGGATTPQTPPQTATTHTPQQGVRKREDGVIVNSKSAGKAPDTKQNGQVTSDTHGYGAPNSVDSHPAGNPINALLATTQAAQAADKTSDTGMGQGSILDSLYSKLKDTDVDYSDLAKRISENEYDLARERKDGTFNAILGGVGAALSKAGTYESHGDRVFRPGIGAIAGAGILSGLKMSSESDAAIAKKSQDNTMSMLALKKLKGDSLNNVLDAISAQKQTDVYAQSVANNAIAHKDTAANQRVENNIKQNQLVLNAQQIAQDTAYKQAMIGKIYNELDPSKQASLDLLKAQLSQYTAAYTDLLKTPGIMPNDPRVIAASKKLNNTNAMIDTMLQGFGNNVNLTPSTDTVGATSGGMTLLNVRDK